MSRFGEHPRFPFGMEPDVRIAIADELDVTMSCYPSSRWRQLAPAITGYAEKLEGFTAEDVRRGFRAARAAAGDYAPSPTAVADAAAAARRRRLDEARANASPTGAEEPPPAPVDPTQIPEWLEVRRRLRGGAQESPTP